MRSVRRRRRSPRSSACRRSVRWRPRQRTSSARRSPPLREDVELLASESDRCRSILARLTVDPAGDVSDAYTLVPLPALIEVASQNYKREGIRITFEAGPRGEGVQHTAPIQVRSPEIMQGIGNIVQNAVSFARNEVHVATHWTTEWSEVEVSDDGPGFSEALLDELGTPFISTRQGEEGHMGLGVFIAKTLLERTGATVTFGNRSSGSGGAAVAVRWPNPVFKAT
jgi:two-component system, sensor histidine kinase RegB